MFENEDIIKKIMESGSLVYTMVIGPRSYPVDAVTIAKSRIPVREPTTRGGVYFTDTTAYKMKAILSDLSIKDQIPKLMLGPNVQFAPIRISTTLKIEDKENMVTIISHLTNSVDTKERVELNLIVDQVELR